MESLDIVLPGPGRVALRRTSVASPTGGHVCVRTRCSIVSPGTERTCFEGRFASETHWASWVTYPFQPGYAAAGTVVDVGPDVATLKAGDRVATYGPHAQYSVQPAADCVPIPSDVADEDAAWLGISRTAQISVERAAIAPRDRIVVVGAGVIGQLIARHAARARPRQTIVIARSELRARMAASCESVEVLRTDVSDALEPIGAATDGDLADVVFDATGFAGSFPHSLSLARRFGRVIVVGDCAFPQQQHLTSDLVTKGLHVIGVHFDHVARCAGEDGAPYGPLVERFWDNIRAGMLRLRELVTHRCDPRDAISFYPALAAGAPDMVGALFDWSVIE